MVRGVRAKLLHQERFPLQYIASLTDHQAETVAQEPEIDINLNVRDGGMAVLTSLSPNVRWKQGIANLTATVAGTVQNPIVSGEALISKALLDCPVLKYPLNLASADIRCKDDIVTVKRDRRVRGKEREDSCSRHSTVKA
jgi:autotransporter translocation and assembly factor TamB